MINQKGINLWDITYQKVLSRVVTSSSTEKKYFHQPIDSDRKRYEEIRKLTTGQGEDWFST